MGKGKGKSQLVTLGGIVDLLESVSASSSARVQRKRQCKLLPDETGHEHWIKHDNNDDNGKHESNDNSPHTHAISAPALVHLDAHPNKCQQTTTTMLSLLSGMTFCHHCRHKMPQPKMCCTLIKALTGVPCCKLFCNGCIEKQ
jgi:hypothetical protein